MAAKKKSGKTRGTDQSGNPIDLGSRAARYNRSQYSNEVSRAQNNFYKNVQRPNFQNRSEAAAAMRNIAEMKNAPKVTGPIKMGPAKSDPLRGRTVDFGTRSTLEGQRSFMRGGGGLNTRGK